MARPVSNPANRFGESQVEWSGPPPRARLRVQEDHTREILARNTSPDVPFTFSVNPYRGCTHACAYCYARTFHEYLGLGAGTDFESRVFVKRDAALLLERAFRRPSWRGERLAFSGVTDCYQPLERRYRITRACLSVCAEFRNPVGIITRSDLIVRDLDVLQRLHGDAAVSVTFSLPLLEPADCLAIEPGAPLPERRLRAMRTLSEAGIPVGVNVAPMIPGLTDARIPDILTAAHEAGARWAGLMLLRLPGAVADVFPERLREALPGRAEAILARLRRIQGGPGFGDRFRGRGVEWQAIRRLFQLWHDRLGYGQHPPSPDPSPFKRPPQGGQLPLFD